MNILQSILCFYLYFLSQAITATAQSTYTRKLLTGNDITLPCDYDQDTDGAWFLITWSVMLGETFRHLYVRSPGGTTNNIDPPPQFAGRISIAPGERTLRLTGVTIDDEDEYRCTVAATNNRQTLVTLQVFKQPSRPQVQVQYDPQPSDTSRVPLNTTVTFTCTSTGGRPPATLTWIGTPGSVTPSYTSSNDTQGVGDATSTFNFTTAEYGVTYSVYCRATGPDPIQTRTSEEASFKTEPDPSATPTTTEGQTGPIINDGSNAPRTGGPNVGGIVGGVVGALAGVAVMAAVVFFVVRKKRADGGEEDGDVGDLAHRQYENVPHPMMASQRPGSGSDEYEVPMETVQPPQSSDDYQELRPAIYQSLQR